jgi:NAD+ synthase (glutamine-hydrolysing)
LRKSGADGFFLPVTGDLNSSVTTLLIYYLCLKIYKEINLRNESVLMALRIITKDEKYMPKSAEEICGKLLKTAYIGTDEKGSRVRQTAIDLAAKTGASHLDTDFGKIFSAFTDWMKENLPNVPRAKADGGSIKEDIILQNLKGRLRMTLSYLLAQLIPTQNGMSNFLFKLKLYRGFLANDR